MQKSGPKHALISVYDKTGVEEFAKGLHDLGIEIYASGGTAKAIKKAGVPVKDVSELVGGGEILGHKVVTLSREVHAGLLAEYNDEDKAEMKKFGLPYIDIVCVDMYPLEEEIAKPEATPESVREKTDIGGPTMLRAAAKGRRIVLSIPAQRPVVLKWLKAGSPDEEKFIEELAARAEYEAARYTLQSAKYLNGFNIAGDVHLLDAKTKYGENPYQIPAGRYFDNRVSPDPLGLDQFEQIKGFEKSYINETDTDRLLQTITHIAAGFEKNFGDVPAIAVGVKHGNACGAGAAKTHTDAVKKMLDGDPRAIFGGVVMINGEITEEVANNLITHGIDDGTKRLLDAVIGAKVSDDALGVLSRKKLRVLTNPALDNLGENSLDKSQFIRRVRGGFLAQPNYTFVPDLSADYIEQTGKASEQQKRDLILAWAIGSTSNSNTITLAKDGQLIGNGTGQQDRVGAAQLAVSRSTTNLPEFDENGEELVMSVRLDGEKLKGASAYSDSFFPFADGPLVLARAGIKAILATRGSVNDESVAEEVNKNGASLITYPDKLGRGFYFH